MTLADALRFYDATCAALCLMPNHYRIVLETPRGNVATVMRYVNGVFAQRSLSTKPRAATQSS